jgi:1L-myo-inositol 1-phosphate cytidylyltransferase
MGITMTEATEVGIRRAVILAAGMGTRLGLGPDSGRELPKPLLPIGGHPLLVWVSRALARCGIERVTLVVGYEGQRLVDFVRTPNRLPPLAYDFVWNDEWQRSNGLSLLKAKDAVREPFVLLMSDHLFEDRLLRGLLAAALGPGEVLLAVDRRIDAIFDLDDATKVRTDGDRIVAIDKRLDRFDAVDCGLFACRPEVFGALAAALVDGDCSLSDGMRQLAAEGRFRAHDIGDAFWQDVDTPEMFAHAERSLDRLT